MKYVLVDAPIFPRRVDRRSPKERRLIRERVEVKRARMLEDFSVEQLIEMGFYEIKTKSRPYGVEVVTAETEKLDADGYELRKITSYRISLHPPDGAPIRSLQRLNPRYCEESESYYWKYPIYGKAMLWVTFDLLSRIVLLPCWDECETIPLFWSAGNNKALLILKKILPSLNEGVFNYQFPPLPVVQDLKEATKRRMLLEFCSEQIKEISNKAMISFLRHQYTPYDYLWQTEKMTRDEAQTLCNKSIELLYPHLFGLGNVKN